MKNLTLGSLFDGSGGFPLGAVLNGITPLWASEIEPFPIRVTTKRFPQMKHLGDISRIHGGKIPPVDIISFGSPCTDMSVAGKRAGITGKQSGLFYEAVRIIKEMRGATDGIYPRFLIFENVPGAFNSGQGADFKAILDAIVQIAEPCAEVPAADKNGWPYADILVGDGWSVAYRLMDAQFFSVPQRRKRIYLVADFASGRAGEILFEREGVRRDFAPGFGAWQGTAGNSPGDAGATSGTDYLTGWDLQNLRVFGAAGVSPTLNGSDGGGGRNPAGFVLSCPEVAGTLTARHDGSPCADRGMTVVAVHQNQAGELRAGDVANTLSTNGNATGRNAPLVAVFMAGQGAKAGSIAYSESVAPTLKGVASGLNQSPCAIVYGICSDASNAMKSPNPYSGVYEAETSRTLDRGGGNPSCNQGGMAVVAYCLQGNMIGRDDKNGPKGDGVNEDVAFTLNTIDRHAVAYDCRNHAASKISGTLQAKNNGGQSLNFTNPVLSGYVVRRLTPQECALLQGFPPHWCAGLDTPEPTEADIVFWAEVWETHRRIVGTSTKPKSRNQIVKWLRQPNSDSAEYKLWGNGVALPCVCFVMAGICEVQ
jgi:DNA (cytosine-5)-methyltransferase 1